MTFTPNAKRLTVELSLPVLTTQVCRGWDSKSQPSACGANAITHCATVLKITISITTQIFKVFGTLLLQWNLSNAPCTVMEKLCWYRQSVGLHSKKHRKWSNKYEIPCQMAQWNRLYRFYCMWNLNPNWPKLVIQVYVYILKVCYVIICLKSYQTRERDILCFLFLKLIKI